MLSTDSDYSAMDQDTGTKGSPPLEPRPRVATVGWLDAALVGGQADHQLTLGSFVAIGCLAPQGGAHEHEHHGDSYGTNRSAAHLRRPYIQSARVSMHRGPCAGPMKIHSEGLGEVGPLRLLHQNDLTITLV
jgi:hypothetical protein